MKIKVEYTVEAPANDFKEAFCMHYGLSSDTPMSEIRVMVKEFCEVNGTQALDDVFCVIQGESDE